MKKYLANFVIAMIISSYYLFEEYHFFVYIKKEQNILYQRTLCPHCGEFVHI